MGWTKADRKRFLDSCEEVRGIMPKEVISLQQNIFEDVIEVDNNVRYQKIKFKLLYPPLDDNPEQNPMAKQSARFTVSRYSNGPKKGDLILYPNKYTGKNDVIIKSYQDTKITKTTEMLQLQIDKQLREQRFTKFRGAIFITRLEFVFKVSKNASKKMMEDLNAGTKIYFKETKPDLDNLEKMVWDAMQSNPISKDIDKMTNDVQKAMLGLVYDNDAQIVSKNGIFKRWGIRPGVICEMEGYI